MCDHVPLRYSSDSQHFKGLRRGVLRAILDLKAENGVFFFRTEVFLDSIFSFLLIFYVTIFSPHETSTRGAVGKGELPRFVPIKHMC